MNLFFILNENDIEYDTSLNLVRLHMNVSIIDEEDQNEIVGLSTFQNSIMVNSENCKRKIEHHALISSQMINPSNGVDQSNIHIIANFPTHFPHDLVRKIDTEIKHTVEKFNILDSNRSISSYTLMHGCRSALRRNEFVKRIFEFEKEGLVKERLHTLKYNFDNTLNIMADKMTINPDVEVFFNLLKMSRFVPFDGLQLLRQSFLQYKLAQEDTEIFSKSSFFDPPRFLKRRLSCISETHYIEFTGNIFTFYGSLHR